VKDRKSIVAALAVLVCGHSHCVFAEPAISPPQALEEEVQVVEGVDCSHGKDVRRLEVLTRQAGCRLLYFKFGKSNELALARSGVEICKDELKNVR